MYRRLRAHAGAVGHDRGGRRRHRRGRGDRRRHARLRRAAAGAERFRQRHLQPQHQAGARRRALPGAGQRLAGDGSAEGARPAAAERAAPGAQSGLRGAELRLVGSAVLRHRPEALQPAGRQVRLRRLADSLAAKRRSSGCPPSDRRACAAASSTSTASSTTRACSSTWWRPPSNRAPTLLNYAQVTRADARMPKASWTACVSAMPRPARSSRRAARW